MKKEEASLSSLDSLILRPIGVVRSPYVEKREAPRQSVVAKGVRGTIELAAGRGFDKALEDIENWSHLWVLFWFHLNEGWRPMVRPPRGDRRRGVLSTRSPHRPNPIGLSVLRLVARRGLVLEVSDLDILDGTPVLDIKPYVAYTDALSETEEGWLQTAADPIGSFSVEFSGRALAQFDFLGQVGALLMAEAKEALTLGPKQPHYRRIKQRNHGYILSLKEWRIHFDSAGRSITVKEVRSGYRPSELVANAGAHLDLHRALAARES